VEVFVMGTPQQLRELRTLLERGPRFSNVTEVREELASPDPQYDQVFVIGHGD
jgi:acylphosphatase